MALIQRLLFAYLLPCLLAATPIAARAQDSAADFYRGKSIAMIIGNTPGGGFDTYARLIARFMSPHVPGNPKFIPQNMPGASSNVAAAYMYNVAPKDGLAIAAISPGAIMAPMLLDRSQVKFDATKFNYVGSATTDVYVCIARKDSPIQDFAQVQTTEFIVGAVAEGGSARDFPVVLRNLIGSKFRIVNGYAGNREVTLAVEKGEVQGVCGNSYAGLRSIQASWFVPDGIAKVIVQEDLKGHPDLNKLGIPLAITFATNEKQRQILTILYQQLLFARPYVMAPGIPEDRLQAIRAAFKATLTDPEFLAEARRINLEVTGPMFGMDLQDLIAKIYATPEDVVTGLQNALKN